MPTIIPKDIKPDGTGDYLTLNSWNAAQAADLVGLDQIRKAIVYSGGNVLSGALIFYSGWTCDATHYPWIVAAAGHGHVGVWDTSKAYGLVAAGASDCLYFTTGAHIDGMQFQSTGIQGTLYVGSRKPLVLRRCIVRSYGLNGACVVLAPGGASTHLIENCVLIADVTIGALPGGTPVCVYLRGNPGGANVTVTNCTLYAKQESLSYFTINLFCTQVGNVITSQNNCLICDGLLSQARCYHASEGTINKGANDATSNAEATTPALRNIAYTVANFLDVTAGSENLHLAAGSALRGVGENLSATFTDDIDGDTRPSLPAPWAIGADDPPHVYDADFSDGGVSGDTTTSVKEFLRSVVEGSVGSDLSPAPLGQLLADMVDQGIASDPVLPAGDYFGLVFEGITAAEQSTEDFYAPGDWVDGGIFGDFFSAPTSGHVYVHPFKIYPIMTKVWARPVMTVTVGSPETRATV